MSLALSDILANRFAFETHAPEEFRKGFADRLPESAFRAGLCHDTIDVSGVRGSRTPDWLTCSPAAWTKHHLEPCLLTAVRSGQSWHMTENTWMLNLLLNHEPVLIPPLVDVSVLPGPAQRSWCCQSWKLRTSTKTASSTPSLTTVLRQCRHPCSTWSGLHGHVSGFHHCSSDLYMEPPPRLASGWLQFRFPILLPRLRSAGERVLRKLVKHLELDEVGSISSLPSLWGAMTRHFHPDWTTPRCPRPSCGDPLSERISCRPWFVKKSSESFLSAKDREVLDKEMDDAARTEKNHVRFMKALTHLRENGAEAAEAESIIHGQCAQHQRSCCLPGPRRFLEPRVGESVGATWRPYSQGFLHCLMAYQVALWQRFPRCRLIWSARVCHCISEDCMGVAYCLHWLAL